ncbi:PRC-barrel domain-containing protein [Oceaniglobus ichthyenteri]|uniref:PRC-barrel domain-containing protein n=1 Tax=Oceaniglobus ichthyenteri TaxID=2136177 RepID=UPI0013DE182E|nr:PRC-barrel domain-containing protein [Oceaniglobus ichthyenteri]
MKTAHVLTILATTAMIAAPATLPAQTATAQSYVEIEDDALMVMPFNLSVDQIDDYDVIGSTGEKVGEIEEVLADATGTPVAVVIETEGFLGLGDEDVIVALDQLELVDGAFRINLTEEELEALPKWDD